MNTGADAVALRSYAARARQALTGSLAALAYGLPPQSATSYPTSQRAEDRGLTPQTAAPYPRVEDHQELGLQPAAAAATTAAQVVTAAITSALRVLAELEATAAAEALVAAVIEAASELVEAEEEAAELASRSRSELALIKRMSAPLTGMAEVRMGSEFVVRRRSSGPITGKVETTTRISEALQQPHAAAVHRQPTNLRWVSSDHDVGSAAAHLCHAPQHSPPEPALQCTADRRSSRRSSRWGSSSSRWSSQVSGSRPKGNQPHPVNRPSKRDGSRCCRWLRAGCSRMGDDDVAD